MKVTTAPYFPFKVFRRGLEALQPPAPARIDRSVWPQEVDESCKKLIRSLRFFQLIDENDAPTEDMQQLVEQRERQQEIFRGVMKYSYTEAFRLDLSVGTREQLEEAIGAYGVTGNTLRKAVAFFIDAAEYCDISLSVHIRKSRRGARRGSRSKAEHIRPGEQQLALPISESLMQEEKFAVGLASGGAVRLTISYKLSEISTDDLRFVRGILRRIQGYQDGRRLR